MSALIVVEGCTISHDVTSSVIITGGEFVITTLADHTILAQNKAVYFGVIIGTFSGGSTVGGTNVIGTFILSANAVKTQKYSNGKKAFLEGCTGTLTGSYTTSGGAVAFTSKIKISVANQTKVLE